MPVMKRQTAQGLPAAPAQTAWNELIKPSSYHYENCAPTKAELNVKILQNKMLYHLFILPHDFLRTGFAWRSGSQSAVTHL